MVAHRVISPNPGQIQRVSNKLQGRQKIELQIKADAGDDACVDPSGDDIPSFVPALGAFFQPN
jgi:hypothetical protein